MEDPKAPLVGTEMVALEDKVPPTKAAPILEKQPPAHRCRKIVGAFVVVAAIVSGLGLILASKSTSGSASAPSPTRAPSLAPVALVACSLSLGGDATADELDDDASRAVITSSIAATLDVDEASIVNLVIADARRRRRLLAVVATFDVMVVASEGDATEALLEEAVASGDLTATIQATAVEEGVAVLEEATADAVAVTVAEVPAPTPRPTPATAPAPTATAYAWSCAEDADCCSDEGGACDCESGPRARVRKKSFPARRVFPAGYVAFGSNGMEWEGYKPMWSYAASPADCTSGAFGGDPAPGYAKWCACVAADLSPTAAPVADRPSPAPSAAPTAGAPTSAPVVAPTAAPTIVFAWDCAGDARCCAEEGGTCACDTGFAAWGSNGMDWEGYNPMWVYAVADSIECSTAAFGDDPAGGYAKWCTCVDGVPDPTAAPSGGPSAPPTPAPLPAPTILPTSAPTTAAPTSAPPTLATFWACSDDPQCCAEDGDTCACDSGFAGYGSNGNDWAGYEPGLWVYAAGDALECSKDGFGQGDPAPGYAKWCSCVGGVPSAMPTTAAPSGSPAPSREYPWDCARDAYCCAEEGETCACDSGAAGFGSNGNEGTGYVLGMWTYAASDSIECSIAAFGEDPAGGYAKWCTCVGAVPTVEPSLAPTTVSPTTARPSLAPTTVSPTTARPSLAPTTVSPTTAGPTAGGPSSAPTTAAPSAFDFWDCDSDPNCCAESGDTCACDSGWMAYGSNGMEWRGTGVRRRARADARARRARSRRFS